MDIRQKVKNVWCIARYRVPRRYWSAFMYMGRITGDDIEWGEQLLRAWGGRVPNAETVRALEQADGGDLKVYESVDDLRKGMVNE